MEEIKKNVYSQNGEDGIIEYLLSKIERDFWCCEFGAFDGKFLSNTFNLIENSDYNAVYIEMDKDRYDALIETCKEFPKIVPINQAVGVSGSDSLDSILSKTEIPKNFDILSIDVDGIDYLIWESLQNYCPKIVIIEINSSLFPHYMMEDEELQYEKMLDLALQISPESGVNYRTCYELGRKKGYKLFTHTGNMIFVHESISDKFNCVKDEDYLQHFDTRFIGPNDVQRWMKRNEANNG